VRWQHFFGPTIIGAAVIFGCLPVSAADDVAQSDVGFFVQTSDGTPTGCGIEFTIVFKDRTNLSGALSAITGSITDSGVKNNLGTMLKFGAMDFVKPDKPRLYKINSASLYSPTVGAINKYTKFPCEQPEGFCARYEIDSTILISQAAIKSGDLRLRFNRAPGQLDVELPISTKGAILAHAKDFDEYAKCETAIANAANREQVRGAFRIKYCADRHRV
jgi:hypothetical protein